MNPRCTICDAWSDAAYDTFKEPYPLGDAPDGDPVEMRAAELAAIAIASSKAVTWTVAVTWRPGPATFSLGEYGGWRAHMNGSDLDPAYDDTEMEAGGLARQIVYGDE